MMSSRRAAPLRRAGACSFRVFCCERVSRERELVARGERARARRAGDARAGVPRPQLDLWCGEQEERKEKKTRPLPDSFFFLPHSLPFFPLSSFQERLGKQQTTMSSSSSTRLLAALLRSHRNRLSSSNSCGSVSSSSSSLQQQQLRLAAFYLSPSTTAFRSLSSSPSATLPPEEKRPTAVVYELLQHSAEPQTTAQLWESAQVRIEIRKRAEREN